MVHRRRNDGRRLRSRGRWAVGDYQVRSVASSDAKAKIWPADVANGRQTGRQWSAQDAGGRWACDRVVVVEVKGGWRPIVTVQACRLAGAEAKGRAQGPGKERSRKKLWEKPRAWRGAARQAKVMFRGPGRSNRGL